MSSFIIEEKVLLGLGFSIFTEREYELKTTDGNTYSLKAIKLFRQGKDFHFTCIDCNEIRYNIIINGESRRCLIKRAI